jgi:hypothetical protein
MDMNNEPVAWMEYIQGEEWEVWFVEPTDLPKGHTYKPLYLRPVKELTDRIAELEKQLDTRTRELIGASFYEHDYKTLMAKPPLTDKEIEEVAVINLGHSMGLLNWMGFARAILRKAQEK